MDWLIGVAALLIAALVGWNRRGRDEAAKDAERVQETKRVIQDEKADIAGDSDVNLRQRLRDHARGK